MKMQSAIRESKNQRNSLLVGVAVIMVSALDLVKMVEAIWRFWDNLGWEIILLPPLLGRAFAIEIYMLLAISGIWLAKACWKARAVGGLRQVCSLLLFAVSSATAVLMMAKLPVEMKIDGSTVMILTAIAIVCVESVRWCSRSLPRPSRRAGLIELTSQG